MPKKKPSKPNPNSKAAQELAHQKWLDGVRSMTTSFSGPNVYGTSTGRLLPKVPHIPGMDRPLIREGADHSRIPSKVTPGASTGTKDIPVYTGTSMIGIGVMHKSNAVPIFREEDAADLSKMRR